jgi:hypothetical protein
MKVQEVAKGATTPADIIKILKVRPTAIPDISELEKSLLVKNHDVFNPAKRENKMTYPNPVTDAAGKVTDKGPGKLEFVNRIGLALQGLIIKRSVAFLFGNAVIKNHNAESENEKSLITCIEQFLEDANEDMLNRQAAKTVFSYKESAEYWFTVAANEKHEEYGFETDRKLRCKVFSQKNGDTLYPLFDESGDMIAFSREFIITTGSIKTTYFETYTDDELVRYKKSSLDDQWIEVHKEVIPIKKIPIIYAYQEQTETEEVDEIIYRLEKLLSNLGDTNDYHSAPKIFVNGKIISFGQKGQSNTVIEGAQNTEAKYLSWDHAPESFKVEVKELIQMLFSITQTPDISFESVKGIGNLSGVALKLMFLDAHLKVKDKEEIFLPFLKRRYSILKAYAVTMNNKLKDAQKLKIKPQIDPYMIADDKVQAEILSIANGGQPFVSQEESVKQWGGNDQDYQNILDESKERNKSILFEPTE